MTELLHSGDAAVLGQHGVCTATVDYAQTRKNGDIESSWPWPASPQYPLASALHQPTATRKHVTNHLQFLFLRPSRDIDEREHSRVPGAGWTTHYIPRTPNSKEYIPYSSNFQKIWSFWQILSHFGSDFGNIVEYIPSIPEVFQCIPYRNIFLAQYFREWSTPRVNVTHGVLLNVMNLQ